MRFFIRKRRPTPTIIIVALIDVLIVLLIFLMVTTTFKQQPAVKIALPESTQAQLTGASETAPLLVTIDQKGVLHLGADNLPITEERFKEKLLEAVAKNPDLKLAINADTGAPFGQVIKVMDAAKAAHLKSAVSAFTKEAAKP